MGVEVLGGDESEADGAFLRLEMEVAASLEVHVGVRRQELSLARF
jgi:hypothetical protein